MIYGLLSGILWAMDTVLMGIIITSEYFTKTNKIIFLAPFISAFLHDMFSSLWMTLYMIIKKKLSKVIKILKTKNGKIIMLASILGGPIGMTSYLLSINFVGASYTAMISAIYPAIGALFSNIFLNEKINKTSLIGLLISIIGIIILGYSKGNEETSSILGLIFAISCVISWALEAVICAYGMKDNDILPEESLQIRQFISAVTYGIFIIPIINELRVTLEIISTSINSYIFLISLLGTSSYIFYYKAINRIGVTRAMALNISYAAWSVLMEIVLLGHKINIKSVISCVLIIIGSIFTVIDINKKE
ncbi:DMT family transporter [Clostridium sp. CAG:265]|uniref:DMT family transporter n=1 Tax=Clostridium sp. CAG:265 TaxID=1262787 RepID=UPI000335B933|nr:DMT family transporter [Clostridium sp. CAG:265]CDB74329.1 integral membrane protein domain protein [Clostridium sp. CAG:265]